MNRDQSPDKIADPKASDKPRTQGAAEATSFPVTMNNPLTSTDANRTKLRRRGPDQIICDPMQSERHMQSCGLQLLLCGAKTLGLCR
jgi:hypothetical protein